MACGCFQVVQAMSNGSAMRSGVAALWVGAMSATISALILLFVAVAIYRLPFPDTNLALAQGMKVFVGGLFGAFIVVGLAFVAPKLGPTQTFLVYFFVVAVTSALIDSFGLLGTGAKPLEARQLIGVLLAGVGLVLARS
jgi:bacterial/archaeal transporter family-2 protein